MLDKHVAYHHIELFPTDWRNQGKYSIIISKKFGEEEKGSMFASSLSSQSPSFTCTMTMIFPVLLAMIKIVSFTHSLVHAS